MPTGLLAGITVPTLVIVGGADYPFMVEVANQLVDGLPDGRLLQLEGQGHDVAPEFVVPEVAKFLQS